MESSSILLRLAAALTVAASAVVVALAADYSYTVTSTGSYYGDYGRFMGKMDYSGYQVVTVDVWSRDDEIAVLTLMDQNPDFEQWTSVLPGQHADILVPPGRAQMAIQDLAYMGTEARVKEDNVQTLIDHEIDLEDLQRDEPLNPDALHPMTFDKFHSTATFYEYFDYLEENYEFFSQETLGWSYEKREMRLGKVCLGGCGHKYVMWVHSGEHSREWIAPAATMYLLKELVEGDADHPELLSMFDWYFYPMVNPDGYEYSRTTDRLWRKTRSSNGIDDPARPECTGTDPNRNYDFKWGEGASSDPCQKDTYGGPKAFSEVEVRTLADFVKANNDVILFANGLHAYMEEGKIMTPWAYTWDEYAPYNKTSDLAQVGKDAILSMHGNNYTIDSVSWGAALVGGSFVDWMYSVAKIPYVICIELKGKDFTAPPADIQPTGEDLVAFYVAVAFELFNQHGYPSSSSVP